MTGVYLAYAVGGKEFQVADNLDALGFDAWCGRCIHFVRRGKRRRPDAVEQPKLPNYLFLRMSEDEWHRLHRLKEAQQVKHLASTLYRLRRDDERALATFRLAVDAAHEEGLKVAARNDMAEMVQFKRGQELIDISGTFGDIVLRFRRMVEKAHELHPLIEAEMEMMGRTVRVELDPLMVRAAE